MSRILVKSIVSINTVMNTNDDISIIHVQRQANVSYLVPVIDLRLRMRLQQNIAQISHTKMQRQT